jgi:DNA-binding transcriptional LysR family regulator
LNLTDLQTFSLVAETGTISAAAKRLDVPKSTVSRRVRRLEDSLGLELLRRSPRAIALTEHGRALHQRTIGALQELRVAADALAHADTEPKGILQVTTTPSFGQNHQFVRCIRSYGLKFPEMTIKLDLTNRLVNLVDEGFDLGLRLHAGELPSSSALMCRRLFRFKRALYASPEYIEEMGAPTALNDLREHRIAAHSVVDTRRIQWNHNGETHGKPIALPTPKFLINDSLALEHFVLSGAGLGLLSTMTGDARADRGELVRLLPEYNQHGASVSLVWPASRHLAPRVRAFIDIAVETLGETARLSHKEQPNL